MNLPNKREEGAKEHCFLPSQPKAHATAQIEQQEDTALTPSGGATC